ncbi:MAG: helix-turn-helix transcriptional regulator, partial [Ktedonobacteraceae bacterium]
MASKANKQPNILLRKQRELRGWSLQEVADQIARLCEAEGKTAAVNLHMVSRWEAGIHQPIPFYRTKLCQLYNLSAAELGFITSPPSPQIEQHIA